MQFREIRMVANVVTMGMAGKNDHVVIISVESGISDLNEVLYK